VTDEPAVRAAAGFTEAYGRPPTGLWAAPGRANLIGEHTDYNDGFVLPFALPLRTVVAAAPADEPGWSVWSEQSGERLGFDPGALKPGALSGWVTYVAGVVWALVDAGYDVPPARLAVASDVPLGAGLSSSAALESAVLTALVDLGDLDLPVEERPALAQRAENVFSGAPCGIMDQSASIRCREGHALFLDCRSLEVEHIPFDLAAAGLALLVIDSRAPHAHATGEYADRRAACESAAATLGVAALRDLGPDDLPAALARLDPVVGRRVRHVVTEDQRVLDAVTLLRAGQPRRVGPLLTRSHASMRDDFAITVAQVDVAVEAALAADAHGARMTGGGFGGCVLALVDSDATDRVIAAVADAYARRDFTPPVSFVATPGPGAVRLS
jgi:galactokinase